jgi:hypothetical protein
MGVRSEYRRKWDRDAAQAQDAWQEELAPTQPAPQPLPQPRQPVMPHYTNGNGQHPATLPWADELAENERQRYAAMVSAPVSRSVDSYSYSPPRIKPSDVRLTAEQAALARSLNVPYETYAMHLLEMEERKKRGDMQQ